MAPSDGCPYHRPFDEYFLECPNYQREPFAAQNLRGAPLATVWTCRHLTIGEYDGTRGVRFRGAATRASWPEVGAHVIREEPQHLIRHFPVRFGQSLVDEAIDGETHQAEAGLERQMQVIEHGPALLQQGRHVPHELG